MRFLHLALLTLLCTCVRAQIPYLQLSPFTTTEIKVATTDITFAYSRPSMRGRKIFGGLEPWDTVWRSSANRNPRLVMSEDFFLGDTRVKAGVYTLFTKPNPDEWTVYLYTDINEYGVPETWDESKVVATMKVKPAALSRSRETLLYTFDEVTNNRLTLVLEWETTRIVIPIGLTTEEQMQKLITKTLDGPDSGDYSNAGMYALRSDNLQLAVNWFDRAIEEDESPSYWEHLFRAKALAKLGKTAEAILGAEKCLELATKSDSEYGMTEGQALLDSLRE